MRLPDHLARSCARCDGPSLASLTTAGVGGKALCLLEPDGAGALAKLLSFLKQESIPHRLLGAGSNVLAPDGGINEVVVRTGRLEGMDVVGGRGVRLRAEAGAPLQRLVSFCSKEGFSGAESLAGIPGSVGGAVMMNAGGRWGEVASLVEEATVVEGDGSVRVLRNAECGFVYRGSNLKGRAVVSITIRLTRSLAERVHATTADIVAHKRKTQPLGEKSCGCVFKNPPGRYAGEILDRAGLKGRRCGGARISTRHANFVINEGGATRGDWDRLIDEARSRVRDLFGLDLELEVEKW